MARGPEPIPPLFSDQSRNGLTKPGKKSMVIEEQIKTGGTYVPDDPVGAAADGHDRRLVLGRDLELVAEYVVEEEAAAVRHRRPELGHRSAVHSQAQPRNSQNPITGARQHARTHAQRDEAEAELMIDFIPALDSCRGEEERIINRKGRLR